MPDSGGFFCGATFSPKAPHKQSQQIMWFFTRKLCWDKDYDASHEEKKVAIFQHQYTLLVKVTHQTCFSKEKKKKNAGKHRLLKYKMWPTLYQDVFLRHAKCNSSLKKKKSYAKQPKYTAVSQERKLAQIKLMTKVTIKQNLP